MNSSFEQIKVHYDFTNGDVRNLLRVKDLMDSKSDEFVRGFYNHVKGFEEADKYLKDDKTVKRHQEALKSWFAGLFDGVYDRRYFDELEKVGMTHVRINLPAHYVNAAMHYVKTFVHKVLAENITDQKECSYIEASVIKILEINLDVFTSSYIEEEKKYFLSQKVENYLVQFANRFSYGLNLILVLGLVILGAMVIWLFIYDLTHVFQGDIEKGLLSTLGSLLMLWVVIELMDTEIRHLKGGKFAIKVFISVALVAIIRKILVTSLQTEAVGAQISLVAAVAVLGVVYWLISRVEK